MTRTFNDNWAVRMVSTPATHAANAHYGEWIDMLGFRRCAFIMLAGELDADMAAVVYQATDDSGSDAQVLDTTLADSFINGTDESRVAIAEVRDADLDDGFRYVTVLVTPGNTDGYACVAVLGEPYEAPVGNLPADGVAFNIGE